MSEAQEPKKHVASDSYSVEKAVSLTTLPLSDYVLLSSVESTVAEKVSCGSMSLAAIKKVNLIGSGFVQPAPNQCITSVVSS
jgi:hypothetical protein